MMTMFANRTVFVRLFFARMKELKGNIRVYARVRPLSDAERAVCGRHDNAKFARAFCFR
jgi:hypothetical protein